MHRMYNFAGGGRGCHRGFGDGRGDRHGLFGGRGRGAWGPDIWEPGDRRPGGPAGPARRGKRFAGEELRLMVLGLLEGAPQHGYQLIRQFAENSGDAYSPSAGMLYPLLTMLADMGQIEEVPGEGIASRRSFSLTDAGKAEVAAKREVIDALFARLASLAQASGRGDDAAPVRRAMMNLRVAAVTRLRREGLDDETAFAIAAILDEAAQKIERIK